jgi:hypothetical protein
MGNKSHLTSVFAAVFLSIASNAFCETPTSSQEMEQYIQNPTEYNSYKDKFVRSFPEKTFKDPRALSSEAWNEPIQRSIERGTHYDKKNKKVTGLPERYVREKRTYQLAKNHKMETTSEVRRQSDGSSSWSGSIRWTNKDE